MTNATYIVVGTEVGEALNTIKFQANGESAITATGNDGVNAPGTIMVSLKADEDLAKVVGDGALTVETIGRMMVHLSELSAVNPVHKKKCEQIVKHALAVHERPDQGLLSDAKKADLLLQIEVELEFESRTTQASGTDKNLRKLVISVDGTLLTGQMANQGAPIPFKPPLTYELDEKLMIAHFQPKFREMLEAFDGTATPGWSEQILQTLLTHSDTWVKGQAYDMSNGQPDPNSVHNQILNEPVRAFHRGVGIYGTNMCR